MTYALLSVDSTTLPPKNILNLPTVHTLDPSFAAFVLEGAQGISLLVPHISKKPFKVDFSSNKMQYRFHQLAYQKELIARACLIKNLDRPVKILDATAGFGRDAFILAASGAEVTLVEQHPIVHLLLNDGINRIQDPMLRQRMNLMHQNSCEALGQLIEKPDVVYLDPMFENCERHAKVKKDLQILQLLCADITHEANPLLPLALEVAMHRVVVKRAIHAEPLAGLNPSFSLSGKHSRFDVYSPHR